MTPTNPLRVHLAGWRLALRVARREALRNRGRSILALVMITLPVLGVVAADVLIQTSDVNGVEGLDRRIGTVAAAQVSVLEDQATVEQAPDPGSWDWSTMDHLDRKATLADVQRVLGEDRPVTAAPSEAEVLVRTDHGRESVVTYEVDARDPLTDGLFRLTSGHWPTTADEVVVNAALVDRGPDVGDTVEASGHDGTTVERTVVGVAESTSLRSTEMILALPGSLPTEEDTSPAWLFGGGPVTWDQVQQLNRLGAVVTSREVVLHPEGIANPMEEYSGRDSNLIAVVALVVTMALLEVVLLAGPAFAVGARKQQRSLALLAASGGTPAQARRVILAGGVVLGATAAVSGVALGIGVAWLLQPVVQRFNGSWLGPFDVPWPHLAGIAAFALLSALLAAVVPAWIASRQNVVAVLAGRRGDPKPSLRSPIIGVLVLAAGVVMAVVGARGRGNLTIAASAIACVLGMVFLVPVVVATVARVSARLPLPLRFAARDAARHRTRTTPAVAAVAATVAGVVALGISTASDEKENRETYEPTLAIGDARISADLSYSQGKPADWDSYRDLVARSAPAAEVTEERGVPQNGTGGSWTDVSFEEPGEGETGSLSPASYGGVDTNVLVSDGTDLPAIVGDSDVLDGDAMRAALAAGKAVVLSADETATDLTEVDLTQAVYPVDGGEAIGKRTTRVPAQVLYVSPEEMAPLLAVVPPNVARKAGIRVETVGLMLAHPDLSERQEKDLQAALADLEIPGYVYVERGYQAEAATVIIQWVLAALGAVLMLGGTLTATFLALSDARPDLATLAAVGAAPRTRRGVGAAYALVVGLVGAVLGALVGAVPGIAVTYPLTDQNDGGWCNASGCTVFAGPGPFLEIPWLMIGCVVVGLPLLVAGVVALFTRSRLPMVSRLS